MAQLFRDVPDALAEWRNAGVKTYVYSSGSREAQRQFFGHTQVGGCGRLCVCIALGACRYLAVCRRPSASSDGSNPPPPTHTGTQVGNLRPYLAGFFDTTSGPKNDAGSYREIAASLGVDPAEEEVVFATDILAEAQAAKAAGWTAVLVAREGNKPLPEGHGFRVVDSMQQLLA